MKPLTLVTSFSPKPFFEKMLSSLVASGLIERIVLVGLRPVHLNIPASCVWVADPLTSHKGLSLILDEIRTSLMLLLLPETKEIEIEPSALERLMKTAESTQAGIVYADYYDQKKREKTIHPLNDYQLGSGRDDFDFGAMLLFSRAALRKAVGKHGFPREVKYAGLYDLRLKVALDHPLNHLNEPIYSVIHDEEAMTESPRPEINLFSYVDPRNLAVQKEMESVFTDYLKRIGAYLPPVYREVEQAPQSFPVEASVIIPVRNRKTTILEAVHSALSQKTDFLFNVIVVDNHSTDGTTAILDALAREFSSVKHIIPRRIDLGIGGCWNEALHADACGRFAVQLDSDDLYSSDRTLQKLVDMLRQGNYALVIGSYTLVNSRREEIPPGLINHREWSDENGRNNALRINGLGAPRAFNTNLLRNIGFLNVSYGEDYAAALRICRHYRIGRIYESLYLCRRWPGNTDHGLSLEEANRHNAFKDMIRTEEIIARQRITKETEMEHLRGFKKPGKRALLPEKTYASFQGEGSLPCLCEKLLSGQMSTWPLLQEGYESLRHIRQRDLTCRGFSVRLQYNPGRIKSVTAELGEKERTDEPCFLCLNHLPDEQQGVLYLGEYLILCNPLPVFPSHFTVSHLDHRHQAIGQQIGTFLKLASDFGPAWMVLYNGPKCGASAPEHLHFQIVPSGQMPCEQEIRESERLSLISQDKGVLIYRVKNLGRKAVILEGNDPLAVECVFKGFTDRLKKALRLSHEPMLNIACYYERNKWRLIIFLRRKHRPDAFFQDGAARLVVSPGAIDMGGILITPVERDFQRLNEVMVESIYEEVSLDSKSFAELYLPLNIY